MVTYVILNVIGSAAPSYSICGISRDENPKIAKKKAEKFIAEVCKPKSTSLDHFFAVEAQDIEEIAPFLFSLDKLYKYSDRVKPFKDPTELWAPRAFAILLGILAVWGVIMLCLHIL